MYNYLINSNKLVITRFSRTRWPIFFSFLIFCCYFTCLKAREISQQNMRNSENIGHIQLGTVMTMMMMMMMIMVNCFCGMVD